MRNIGNAENFNHGIASLMLLDAVVLVFLNDWGLNE
jgi:hypothetical protein